MPKTEYIRNLSEISAELLLGYLYPELTGKWMPYHAGTFYRNYNNDVMALYPDEPTVVLSRDGFLKLLPQGMLQVEQKDQLSLLRDAFLPIDAYWFNAKLQAELQISQLLQTKLDYLLREYFGFDLAAQTNPYIRQTAVLLPFVRSKRGDFAFIRELISTIVHGPVEMTVGRYSDADTTVAWLPRLQWTLLINDLSNEQYNQLMSDLQPWFDFIRQWLIPVEIHCEFAVREYHPHPLNNALTLNYNSYISSKS